MQNYPIQLSKASIKAVCEICRIVTDKCSKNQKSVEMAHGIADFVKEHGVVSEKQAIWICRNTGYWRLDRPSELEDVRVPKGKTKASASIEQADGEIEPVRGWLAEQLRDIQRKLDLLLTTVCGH